MSNKEYKKVGLKLPRKLWAEVKKQSELQDKPAFKIVEEILEKELTES